MVEQICNYCHQLKVAATIEGGGKQWTCANMQCSKVRYDLYLHQGGCGIRNFEYFQNAAGQLQLVEVPANFVRPENWDGKPPEGFTPPLSFAQWKAAGEPKAWNSGIKAATM